MNGHAIAEFLLFAAAGTLFIGALIVLLLAVTRCSHALQGCRKHVQAIAAICCIGLLCGLIVQLVKL